LNQHTKQHINFFHLIEYGIDADVRLITFIWGVFRTFKLCVNSHFKLVWVYLRG